MRARLVAVVLGLALSPAVAHEPATDEAAVKAVVTSFQDCWNRHDMDHFAALAMRTSPRKKTKRAS